MEDTTAYMKFEGKTRKLTEMYAGADFTGDEDAVNALDRMKTFAVFESEDEIDAVQEMLEQIVEDPDYNGHMERYRRDVRLRCEEARAEFW